jgi:glycosyltransferase 2 family protein
MKIRLLSILVSITIIALIYWQVDFEKIILVFLEVNILWLVLALFIVIPTILLTALRLKFLSLQSNKIDYLDAIKLILAASVMNLVLPSKMGDVAKGVFIVKDKNISYAQAIPLVVFEKINDILALLLWCIFGLILLQKFGGIYVILLSLSLLFFVFGVLAVSSKLFANIIFNLILLFLPNSFSVSTNKFRNGWLEVCNFINKEKSKVLMLALLSIFIWFLHLLQIWLFILSLGSSVDFMLSLAITPLAIFAGLLPLTFSGIGTRDFAFIYLYAAYLSAPTAAALGLLATLRYIIPAIMGIPFFSYYIKKIR